MRNDQYPVGTVRALLDTELVSKATRKILQNRLEKKKVIYPVFFEQNAFETVRAVCMRLIPQTDRVDQIDLPGMLDEHLASDKGNGWRYDQMPVDAVLFKNGIVGIDQTSEILFAGDFKDLLHSEQDIVLGVIQSGEAKGQTWEEMSSKIFFEEFLATLVELYYSHPIAKEEIGEVAFADSKGWSRIGLNEHEAHEPLPVKKAFDE